ncbi:MAG: hypothetical protein OXD42_05110 [Rhodospirillaceae bacterium]|nr:hypothetical protein [Rhodospirillaceae bacterium]
MNPNQEDVRDQKKTALLILSICGLVLIAVGLLVLIVGPFVLEATSAGLGLKDSAIIAFGITLVLMIVLAVAAGDGLLGEIQFMIGGFAGFFIVIWLMIAWIF